MGLRNGNPVMCFRQWGARRYWEVFPAVGDAYSAHLVCSPFAMRSRNEGRRWALPTNDGILAPKDPLQTAQNQPQNHSVDGHHYYDAPTNITIRCSERERSC